MGNRVVAGFTIRNQNGLGEPQNVNTFDNKAHGMACAGIIAASNNTIGIRGIANNVTVLPVNIVPDAAFEFNGQVIYGFGTNIEIAQAINWAWRRADVLSCSWGGGLPSNDITSAIDSARNFGRNGRGTVVVFASGNNWPGATDVAYPGRADGVITVGAINNQGAIWNYSQRGISMDLVTPSGNVSTGDVRTTDRMGNLGYNTNGNYMDNFGGTSAACPQVAGVAALMLSVRPDLTETQIRTTLQQTATDMGATGFDNTFGFGRLNAFAAIQAIAPFLSGPSTVCSTGSTFTVNNAGGALVTWTCSPNLTFDNQPGNQKTFYANGSGSGSVTATINSTTCGSEQLPAKTVWVGPPNNSQITAVVMQGPPAGNQLCRNSEMTIAVGHPAITEQGIYQFDWLFGAWNPYFVSYINMGGVINRRATLNLSSSAPASQVITISAINGCLGTPFQKTFYAITCGYSMVFSPNPANDNTEVTLTNTDESDAVAYTVKVTNNSGQTLFINKNSGKRFTLPTSSLKDGLYIVEVVKGNEVYRENLVVKH